MLYRLSFSDEDSNYLVYMSICHGCNSHVKLIVLRKRSWRIARIHENIYHISSGIFTINIEHECKCNFRASERIEIGVDTDDILDSKVIENSHDI